MSKLSTWWDKHVSHATDIREQRKAVAEQAKFYQSQREALQGELDRTNAERDMERRRIQEKQIRALRRNYRAPGFLDVANPVSGMSDQLG